MNVGIISQARMGSERLPGKVLRPLGDKSALLWHVERVLQSGFPLYVATTDESQDDCIEQFCEDQDVPCYRGSQQNVLDRFYQTAKHFHLDVIVRVTSDCPLIDGAWIAKGVQQYLSLDDDRCISSNTQIRTFPRGFDFEIFSFAMLEMAVQNASSIFEQEHVTPYMYQNVPERYSHDAIVYEEDKSLYRLTLDTEDDEALLSVLFKRFDAGHKSAQEIVAIMDQNDTLKEMNAHVQQKHN